MVYISILSGIAGIVFSVIGFQKNIIAETGEGLNSAIQQSAISAIATNYLLIAICLFIIMAVTAIAASISKSKQEIINSLSMGFGGLDTTLKGK